MNSGLFEQISKKIWFMLKLSQEQKDWWTTLDMNCPYLCKMWHGMFGTAEQRVTQLYIIRENQGFTLKK